MNRIRYEQYQPEPRLRGAAHRAWRATVHASIDDFLIVPDGCVDVLFSPNGGLQVVGTMTAAQSLSLPAAAEVVGVRLQPGAALPWLRADMAQLTNDQVPLRDMLGPTVSALEDQLCAIGDPRHRAMALGKKISESVVSSWAEAPPQAHALQRAVAALARADGDLSVEWLALQSNLSTRQFQRRCRMATGLSPKRLARVFRLLRALREKARTGASWTTIAADCGYADQAHFSHDFTNLVGCCPGVYAERGGDVRFSQAVGTDGP